MRAIALLAVLPALAAALQTPLLTALPSPQSAGLSGRFLHITDLHIDPYYQEGSLIASGCHVLPAESVGASRKPGREGLAGKFGAPGSGCDSPLTLVNETMRFIKDVLRPKGLDFVVWTGDSARHDSDSNIPRTASDIKGINLLAVKYLVEAFTSEDGEIAVPIVPNIGNNDIWPHNDLSYTPGRRNPTLEFYALLWAPFIPATQVEIFKQTGNFWIEVNGILVASINTMYLSDANRQVADCAPVDGSGAALPPQAGDETLAWLKSEVLERARREGKVAYLIGHVPPNPLNYFDNCYETFARLMLEYADEVRGQFYGHMNIDHFFFSSSIIPVGKTDSGAPSATTSLASTYREVLKSTLPDFSSLSMAPLAAKTGGAVSALIPSWINLYYHYLLTHYKHLARQHSRDPASTTLHPIFVAPSVVPTFNPGLRVFQYNVETASFRGPLHPPHRERRSTGSPVAPRRGELLSYAQYYADLERWNAAAVESGRNANTFDPLEENPEFPGYLYQTAYSPALEYDFAAGKFDIAEWLRFGGRMTGVVKEKGDDETTLVKRFAKNMVVRLDGVEVKDW
ncbi:Endopolyphosphatase [Geranomyces variabilis]|uniref:Endopolyphosphatase n=1 Tax=Geranomyces variabilis TaxID=109894 RepID=A0AAD5TNX3_9FUNG|nr:Endopolyphosphatase [Geranomyces variabilis]